jgi:hypothetical protein
MKRSSLFICLLFVLLMVMAVTPLASASPSISDVRPGSGPLGETVRVTITGSGFDSGHKVWLTKCGIVDNDGVYGYLVGSVVSLSDTEITADFSLSGKWAVVADYDVKVVRGTIPEAAMSKGFEIYKGSGAGSSTTTTTTSVTATTRTTRTTREQSGENSVFFETNPNGATIFVDGEEVGTSTFTYRTYKDGVHDVLIRKIGYEDYSDRVTIIDNQRVYFSAILTPLAAGSTQGTTLTTAASGTPAKAVTTIRKSTVKIPTPLGTDPPPAEESPGNPATALCAATAAIVLVAIRRR